MAIVLSVQPPPLCRDPDDDLILALGTNAGCEYLITGDLDLLVLGSVGELRIVTPREFDSILGMR